MPLADCALIMPPNSNRLDDVLLLSAGPCPKHGFRIINDRDHVTCTTSPLAIAFLGSGTIDPTVALLIGHRIAAKRSTVLLTEQYSSPASQQVFHLMVSNLLGMDCKAVPIPKDLENEDERKVAIDAIDSAIVSALSNTRKINSCYRSHPYVEFRHDRQTGACPCTAESSDARFFFEWGKSVIGADGAERFEYKSVIGIEASDLIEHMKTLFYEPQWQKFLDDQNTLFARLLAQTPGPARIAG